MSLYRYFASKKPLPTVQRKPIKVPPLLDKSIALNSILTLDAYFEEQFEILSCKKNPPIAAGEQIQKPYVYKVRGIRGITNETHLNQLVDYIKENVEEQNRVEFWSIWHSEKVSSNNIYRLNPQQVTIEDLRFLNNNANSCIKFFPKNKNFIEM